MKPDHPPAFFTARCENSDAQFDAWPDRPLLHSMEEGGINWPSSCRNGTCRTCIGTLVSGSVRYEIEWPGLLPEEKETGHVLPCVAYPCSELTIRKED